MVTKLQTEAVLNSFFMQGVSEVAIMSGVEKENCNEYGVQINEKKSGVHGREKDNNVIAYSTEKSG